MDKFNFNFYNSNLEYLQSAYDKSQYYIKHLKQDIELQNKQLNSLLYKIELQNKELDLYKKLITPEILKKCPELLEYLI
jgi:hypothetical protein